MPQMGLFIGSWGAQGKILTLKDVRFNDPRRRSVLQRRSPSREIQENLQATGAQANRVHLQLKLARSQPTVVCLCGIKGSAACVFLVYGSFAWDA